MKTPVKKSDRKNQTRTYSPFLPFKRLDPAAEIAYYYGFMPIKTPVIEPEDTSLARRATEGDLHSKNYVCSNKTELCINVEEKAALLRECEEKKLLNQSQTTMVYYEGPVRHAKHGKMTKDSCKKVHLDILGTGKSIAEAELIKTAIEILREKGAKDLYVDINSIGDKDSLGNFLREIQQFYRKHADELQAACRVQARKNPFAPFECENQKCRELLVNAPKSIAYLTELSRLHFREVLEYLESMHIPYRIDNRILGNRKICCHTIFLIKTLNVEQKNDEPEETLALGYRYNGLARKLDMKKDVMGVGVTIALDNVKGKHMVCHEPKKQKICLIQFGFEAKLKSFEVIETLRRARIPVFQMLSKDKLSSQIASAEHLGVPYVILMGQKEALENSVMVRDMGTRTQETVKIPELLCYLKKLLR